MSDSMWPEPSKEEQEAEQQEQSRLIASMPVIQDVLDWFDKQIAYYKNPALITGVTPSTDAEHVKSQLLLVQAQLHDFKRQREDFITAFARYIETAADEA